MEAVRARVLTENWVIYSDAETPGRAAYNRASWSIPSFLHITHLRPAFTTCSFLTLMEAKARRCLSDPSCLCFGRSEGFVVCRGKKEEGRSGLGCKKEEKKRPPSQPTTEHTHIGKMNRSKGIPDRGALVGQNNRIWTPTSIVRPKSGINSKPCFDSSCRCVHAISYWASLMQVPAASAISGASPITLYEPRC
jgi:hypothetical protein